MTQTTFKRVPFNLELAKKIASKETKGRIVTRDGRQVRIICFDKIGVHGACQIVALFRVHPDEETVFTFSNEGVYRFGNKTCYDLFLEVPTYYRDYSNFVPSKWQPCLVRCSDKDTWGVLVCAGKNSVGDVVFYGGNGKAYTWKHCLPLSKVTQRLIDTKKSYEELIKELDAESTKNKQQ